MRLRALVFLMYVAGCGGVTSEVDATVIDAPAIDAAADGPVGPDAPIDAPGPRCNPLAPFGTRMPLTTLNTASDDYGPTLSPDETTIYFSSNRPGGMGMADIYFSTRSSSTGAFPLASLLNGVNSGDIDGRPTVTADGLTIYAEIKRGANPYHLERATRQNTSQSFGGMTPVTALNSGGNDVAPTVLPDHSAIYFVSSRNGNEIWRAGGTAGTWSGPTVATGTNLQSASTEDYPAISANELQLFFSSDRPGTLGSYDIWLATRTSVAQGFGQPSNVTELNTTGGETAGWISTDGCVFYFTGTGAGTDLFFAVRGM